MRKYVPELGRYAVFPDGATDAEIQRRVNEYLGKQSKDDDIDVLDSLKSGWSSGVADLKDTTADYLDLL